MLLRLKRVIGYGSTPIGLIFQLGVVLSLLVGAAIVYMVLSNRCCQSIARIRNLIGNGLFSWVLSECCDDSSPNHVFLGFFAAWASAEVLYAVTSWRPQIPIRNDQLHCILGWRTRTGEVVVAVGLLALRKLCKAEPASLF